MSSLLGAALKRSRWIKLGLVIIFLLVMEVPSLVKTAAIELSSGKDVTSEDSRVATKRLSDLSNSLIVKARSLGSNYTPKKYFNDVEEILNSPDFNKAAFAFSGIMKLQALLGKNFSIKEVTTVRDQMGYDPLPHSKKYSTKNEGFDVESIINWMTKRYFMCMPVALILFLLWLCAGADETKRFWPTWWRFLLALIGYPLVIVFTWHSKLKDKGRGWLAEAVLRQGKKNLTQNLSQEDHEKIKLFVGSQQAVSSWRQDLRKAGLNPRHSFVAALMVVMILSLGVRVSLASPSVFHHDRISIEKNEGYLPRDKIEVGGAGEIIHLDHWALLSGEVEINLASPLISRVLERMVQLLSLTLEPPDHVPWSTAELIGFNTLH